ncbi:MAG: GNAT family N-acetyltransferase [Candidatus Eisenbacteria bacterium]
MTGPRTRTRVRNMEPGDFEGIIELTKRVYVDAPPWNRDQLASHLRIFPEGQLVAERPGHPGIAGMAASLIVRWDDYEPTASWRDFTDSGMFTNHDPARGRTLYGAEVMVDPDIQRSGVGAMLYHARRDLAIRLGLLRIRAAARLRGYHRYAKRMSAEEYVERVVRGEINGPTLSFQLREGFHVLQVIPGYLKADPESLGYAALIEWLNPAEAQPSDLEDLDPRFRPRA